MLLQKVKHNIARDGIVESEMERATRRRDLSSGAEDSSSGSATEEDKDIDRHSDESDTEEEDSESAGTISPPTSPRGKHNGSRKKTGLYYSDRFSYLGSMSRQERRRIEGEIIKGRKLGE